MKVGTARPTRTTTPVASAAGVASRLLGGALSFLAAAVMLVPAGAGAADVPTYPTLARNTVIHSNGIEGVAFRVPKPIRIYENSMSISTPPETKIAVVDISDRHTHWWCDFCADNWIHYYPTAPAPEDHSTAKGSCTNEAGDDIGCPYGPGLLEVYISADGPVTFTLEIPQLDGSLELDATGHVDGLLRVIEPKNSPPTDDGTFFHGGEAHPVGMDGRGARSSAMFVYSNPPDPTIRVAPAVGNARMCAYPDDEGAGNPDPGAHPDGCDETVEPGFCVLTCAAWGTPWVAALTHGTQYIGFHGYLKGYTPYSLTFWGLWLTQDIHCPSLDFFDCDKPT